MKRKLLTLLLVVSVLGMTAGCSMFTSGDEGTNKEDDNGKDKEDDKEDDKEGDKPAAGEGVKITDSFTHEDPTDIEFDVRRVIEFPEGSAYVASMDEQQGVKAICAYIVVYGKDDKVVGHYEYTVCEDEANAKKLTEAQAEWVPNGNTEGNVSYFFKTGEAMQADITQYVGMQMMEDESVDSYMNVFLGTDFGAVEK